MSIEMIKLSLKNPRRPLYTGFLALALLTYWLVEIWSEPEQTGLLVTKGELVQTVLANGRVQLPERVEISSKMNGKVASLPVVVGQSVRAGETLLVLESSRVRAMLAQAKAGVSHAAARLRKLNELTQTGSVQMLHRAQATMDSANKQYARVNNLAAKGYVGQDQVSESLRNLAIAQSQLANAQFQAKASRGKGSDYALAESALNKARANEQAAREKLDNTVVKATSDGVLISSNTEQGKRVMAGKPLMAMSSASKAQILAQIDDKNIHLLKPGQQALIVAEENPLQHFNADLSFINPPMADKPGSVEVKLDVVAQPESLRHGMAVSIAIVVARYADVLSLSTAAIHEPAGAAPWVMVVENGKAQRRIIKLGVHGDAKSEILEGLREGDMVLPAAGLDVEEGKRIRLSKK